jgi:stage II sporulation protein D
MRWAMYVTLVAGAVGAATSCTRRPLRVDASANGDVAPVRRPASSRDASLRIVRVALATRLASVELSSDGAWTLFASDGATPLALTQAGERWVLERDGERVSARRSDSHPVSLRDTLVVARSTEAGGTIRFNGRRYRGELLLRATDGGIMVVNRLPMDDYLRGVVPREIGTSDAGDLAAVEAQAVAARSYAYTRLAGASRPYDLVATVQDQVYGGFTSETAAGNEAVERTAGLVLLYGGRVVNAPYHANCGGFTAAPEDSWNVDSEPYLRRVSDRIPGTDRYYCDWAPKFRWTRRYSGDQLRASVARYVRGLPGGSGGITRVRNLRVTDVTPVGRVATLAVDTDRGSWTLRGNQIRQALRLPSGEMLYSTYFSVDADVRGGEVKTLVLEGGGNGHGIGMCQSGAIGRARAGQDFRTILATYYPGTTVGTVE